MPQVEVEVEDECDEVDAEQIVLIMLEAMRMGPAITRGQRIYKYAIRTHFCPVFLHRIILQD